MNIVSACPQPPPPSRPRRQHVLGDLLLVLGLLGAILLAIFVVWMLPPFEMGNYRPVEFSELGGFPFALGPELMHSTNAVEAAARTLALVPEPIRRLDGCKLSVRGFVLPFKSDNGRATEFLLLRDRSMCCFGITPQPNQWIAIHAAPPGVRFTMDQLMTVFGTLHVGDFREAGRLLGIYEMRADNSFLAADESTQ